MSDIHPSTEPVDTMTPVQMAAWLRETARITRAAGQTAPTPAEMRVAPHVAFRLEQAAELLLDLQQFHEWAESQCKDHAAQLIEIEGLRTALTKIANAKCHEWTWYKNKARDALTALDRSQL